VCGGSLVVTLWTLRGELHLATTYTEPVVSQPVAQRFMDLVVETLTQYAAPEGSAAGRPCESLHSVPA
jgi:hypothetical protein